MSLTLKYSSHNQRLYHSSAISYIKWCIHRVSRSSTHLNLVVHLSIKTHPARLLTFQTFSYSLKCSNTLLLCHLRLVFFVFYVFDFIVLFYTSFRTCLVVQIFFFIFFLVFMSFYIPLVMTSCRHQQEVTPPKSLEPIQGIALQSPFYPSGPPIECFYSQKSCDRFCAHFRSVVLRLNARLTFVPFRTLFFPPFSKRKSGNPCSLCKVLVILFQFSCSMQTCLVSPFISPLYQSSMYSTCQNLMLVFLLSFQGFSFSLMESSFQLQFFCMVLLVSFLHIFLWLASLSHLGFLLLSLHILSIPHPILPRFIDRLLVSSMPYSRDNSSTQDRSVSIPSPHIETSLSDVVHFILDSSSLDC